MIIRAEMIPSFHAVSGVKVWRATSGRDVINWELTSILHCDITGAIDDTIDCKRTTGWRKKRGHPISLQIF